MSKYFVPSLWTLEYENNTGRILNNNNKKKGQYLKPDP